jgi:hypothetical protein
MGRHKQLCAARGQGIWRAKEGEMRERKDRCRSACSEHHSENESEKEVKRKFANEEKEEDGGGGLENYV